MYNVYPPYYSDVNKCYSESVASQKPNLDKHPQGNIPVDTHSKHMMIVA